MPDPDEQVAQLSVARSRSGAWDRASPSPRLLPAVQRSILQNSCRLWGICSVRAPPSSGRGCRHGWLLLLEGELSPCHGAAPCSPPGPGEAGAGRKGLENRFGVRMWWEGQEKPPEHHGSGPLVNAWCHPCCPLENAVRHQRLVQLMETWGGAFSHQWFPLFILIPPRWWF